MATVESYTKAKIDALIDATIVDAQVIGGQLILTKEDGTTINLGNVGGVAKLNAFPAAPTDGDLVVRTDLAGDPLYKFSDGAWELQPRIGATTVPSARVRRTTTQAIANSTPTVLSFDTVDHDTNVLWASGTPTRLTIKTPGLYLVTGNVDWATNSSGPRDAWIQRNGNTLDRLTESMGGPAATGEARQNISSVVRLAAGDYLELGVYQGSGGALNVAPGTSESNLLTATWLGGPGQTVDDRSIPFARVNKTAAQSVPRVTSAALAFDSEESDNDNIHDNVTNNTRLTCRTPGVYSVTGRVEYPSDGTGLVRYAWLAKNGAIVAETNQPPVNAGGYGTWVEVTTLIQLAVGDYIELFAYHDATVALSVATGQTRLSMAKVGSPTGGVGDVQEGWHVLGAAGEPALQNGVTNYQNAGFRKSRDGSTCQLKGLLQYPNAGLNPGGLIFTLPVGYRPLEPIETPIKVNANTGAVVGLRIEASGQVKVGTEGAAWPAGGPAIAYIGNVNIPIG